MLIFTEALAEYYSGVESRKAAALDRLTPAQRAAFLAIDRIVTSGLSLSQPPDESEMADLFEDIAGIIEQSVLDKPHGYQAEVLVPAISGSWRTFGPLERSEDSAAWNVASHGQVVGCEYRIVPLYAGSPVPVFPEVSKRSNKTGRFAYMYGQTRRKYNGTQYLVLGPGQDGMVQVRWDDGCVADRSARLCLSDEVVT